MTLLAASTRALRSIAAISRTRNQSISQQPAGRIGSLWSTSTSIKNNSLIQRQAAAFSTGAVWQHGALPRPAPGTGIKVNFIKPNGETVTVEANEGESLLDLARATDMDVEGACEASLACSTCHLILDDASFDKLEEPSDEENDMLDLAFGLTDTSRLGCQVLMTKELAGLTAKIPSATRNMYVDGAKPKHH
ncbi:MAG: 2Fe-2S ferredoxin-type domain-containing protein [Linnemannia gamsii]|nr:MAG: 2Fe-2S ferredoxin-type domain-containing protein [Linnemannia gamsii]